MANGLVRRGAILLFPIFLLICISRSSATTYYVSNSGNDANPGTSPGAPWATIAKVNATNFLPGDALLFNGGQTFSGNIYFSATDANNPSQIVTISTYGTGQATINAGSSYGFYAYNTQGFTVSNLIFDGNSATTNTNAGILIFSDLTGDVKFSGISLSNIEVKNFGAEGVKIYTTKNLTGFQNLSLNSLVVHDVMKNGIVIYGFVAQSLIGWQHKNISISNCEVYNVPGSPLSAALEGNGIVMEGVDGGVIQYCVAHNNGQNNINCGGPAGIWSLESNNVTIQYCESYQNHNGTGCDGVGFDLDGGVTNSTMQYNYAHDNDGAGYLLGQYANARPWNNNTMRYNISENDGVRNEGAIGLFKGPGTVMNGAYIYNNTVFVSPQASNANLSAVYVQNWYTGIDNANFYNNIFITTGGMTLLNIPVGYSPFFSGNLYWTSGSLFQIKYQAITYSSLNAWRAATGNESLGGTNTGYNSNPALSNPGAGGTIGFGNSLTSLNAYKIQSASSPAYHAALDLNAQFGINPGPTDFWNNILPGGNANDLGANQYSTILPVKLLDFHASCSGSEQKISWNTAEESNLKSFSVLYSRDGIGFSKIAEVNPRGSYSEYSYLNKDAAGGNNFYQLAMTDLDGSVAHSPVVNIKCEPNALLAKLWPNPFNRYITVSLDSKSDAVASLVLFDALGKTVLQKQVQVQAGNNQITLDGIAEFPPGNYYLQVLYPGKTEHFKLLKTVE